MSNGGEASHVDVGNNEEEGESKNPSTSMENMNLGHNENGPLMSSMDTLPTFSTTNPSIDQFELEYTTICCGKQLTNVPYKVLIQFIISLCALVPFIVFIFLGTIPTAISTSVISGIVAFWLPSPLQSNKTSTDAATTASLIRQNYSLNLQQQRYNMASRNAV